MDLDDWIIALHILSAFALVSAIVVVWSGYLVGRSGGDAPAGLGRLFLIGSIVAGLGSTGTLVFGVWLAVSLDAYELWDGWVIAALVLWAIGSAAGGRSGKLGQEPGNLRQAITLHAVSSIAVVLILADMIWKPGA